QSKGARPFPGLSRAVGPGLGRVPVRYGTPWGTTFPIHFLAGVPGMRIDLNRPALAVLLAFWLPGCAEAPRETAAASSRDSAGIRIVVNGAGSWQDGQGWTIDDAPLVSIAGTPDAELTQIVGAVLQSDGRLAAASALANAVRFFDSTGRSVGILGRP